MQTLKTAAIVVLIMTVLYNAYLALTTPQEPLPAEIENMLVETGDFDIEAGFPSPSEIFAMGDEPSENAGDDAAEPNSLTQPNSLTVPSFDVASNQMNASSGPANTGAATATLSDNAVAGEMPSPLPPAPLSASPNSIQINTAQNYPSTASQFAIPDPTKVTSSFDSSTGAAYSINDSGSAQIAGTNSATASLTDQTNGVQTASASLAAGDSVTPASATSATAPASATESLGQAGVPMATTASGPNLGLANAIQTADKQYKADQRKEALATLSLFYSTPNLSPSEREQLLSRLDPLAGEVIYSRRHLTEQPHRVGHNETLMEIAARYEVPWQLLANINNIQDPVTVLPGTELKVVRGPFRAEVSLDNQELTLFMGDLYAGRFPIAVGSDPVPKPGTYTVQDKQTSRTYYDAAGTPVPANSPNNPYGTVWMDLGGQLSIHGSPERTRPTDKGCLSLSGDFAEDVYGILSQGSSVTIRR